MERVANRSTTTEIFAAIQTMLYIIYLISLLIGLFPLPSCTQIKCKSNKLSVVVVRLDIIV